MKNNNKVSNPAIEKLVSEILSQSDPSEIFGKEGIFQGIKKQIVNKILEKEMESHIGYEKHSKNEKYSDNRRNGNYEKTLIDPEGRKLTVEVPRDRDGEFEPQLIPKGVRKFEGFDDKVISLYARGMTIREIQGHLEELYATKVSSELISKVTDGILEEVTAWQNRALDSIYPIVYLDCIYVKGRDNASIHKSPLVKELIENAGCTLIYLPVYSPDLNSIEHCWANFKNYLRKIIKNFKDFRDAITAAMVKTFPS